MANDTPTQAEQDQATLVHHELAEAVNRLAKEGFPAPILLAGLASCAADLLTCTVGVDQVPRWFAAQAITTADMLRAAG